MRCKVQVTQEDIDKGEKFDSDKCALARGIKHSDLPPIRSVAVGPLLGYIFLEDGKELMFRLPYEAQIFRRSFDMGESVSPIAFELELE